MSTACSFWLAVASIAFEVARQAGEIHAFQVGEDLGQAGLILGDRRGHGGHDDALGVGGRHPGRILVRVVEIELDEEQAGGEADHAELRAQAVVDQRLQRGPVGHIDGLTLVVDDHVAAEFAHHRDHGFVARGVVADVEVDHPADPHAAQLHRRAQVEAVDRFVEVNHEPLRLGEEVHAAERQQRDEHEQHRAEHEHADHGWTDLGFHVNG